MMRVIIASQVSKHDPPSKLENLESCLVMFGSWFLVWQVGVDIVSSRARFGGPNEVVLDDGRRLRFRKCAWEQRNQSLSRL